MPGSVHHAIAPGADTPPPAPGRRIVVVGTSGSGKTTVAKVIAERLGIAYVSNDALIWGPNWTQVPRDQWPARFEAATRGSAWVLDGNRASPHGPEDAVVLERADTVVWLNLPRRVVMRQVARRTLRRVVMRERLWHGNVETWRMALCSRDSILLWAWTSYPRQKRGIGAFFADPAWGHLMRIRLSSRWEIEAWLAGLDSLGAATHPI